MITAPTPEEVEQLVRWAQEMQIPPLDLARLETDIQTISGRAAGSLPIPDLRQED